MDEKYIVSTIFLILLYTQVSESVSSYQCINLPDTGYDFSSLAKQGPLDSTIGNITFWFLPFKGSSAKEKDEHIVSFCTWSNGNDSISLGNVTENKLNLGPDQKQILMIVYDHDKNATNINLICCQSCSLGLEYDISSSNASLTNLLLLTPEVCKFQSQGMSGWSVFLLLLLIFSGVYFIGGALALKYLRGATGWEMMPNQAFWFSVGRQVQAGFMFIRNGCKEDIYEQI